LGKISAPSDKDGKRVKKARIERLTRPDANALLRYDRKTGHLLQYNDQTGEVDIPNMEVLRNKGTIQRLLDNKLIFPSGILTQKGLQACERLAKLLKVPEPSAPVQNETAPRSPGPRPPEPAATPALQSKQAGPAPVEKSAEAISPETDMFISDHEAGEREAAEKPLTISAAPAAPQPEYDESALDKNLVSLLDPQSYEAEQFKRLRTNILFPISGTAPQSILVTSAVRAEGKSFVASNLAISIAMNVNKHVLLIDCDLRNPGIHRRFGFGNVRGLSEYLNDHTDLDRLLLRTHVEKLTILPGGTKPPNPS
jgi:Mrp family chromosome partitioning ATPase